MNPLWPWVDLMDFLEDAGKGSVMFFGLLVLYAVWANRPAPVRGKHAASHRSPAAADGDTDEAAR